jgi:hypothetical protein
MMGRHAWLRLKPSSLLKLSGCSISDHGEHFHTSDPDDDDRDGHRNVGAIRTPNAADSPRRLHQVHSPRKHQDLKLTFVSMSLQHLSV